VSWQVRHATSLHRRATEVASGLSTQFAVFQGQAFREVRKQQNALTWPLKSDAKLPLDTIGDVENRLAHPL